MRPSTHLADHALRRTAGPGQEATCQPPFEVADVIRTAGNGFRQRYEASLTWPQRKVLDAIVHCRTAALGGPLFSSSVVALSVMNTHTASGTAPMLTEETLRQTRYNFPVPQDLPRARFPAE
jgi:hypothetical protein